MAKDIIFRQEPRFPEIRKRIKEHIKINNVVEDMKKMIQCATTLPNASAILRYQFPFANPTMIYAALRESFGATDKEIERTF